MGKLFNACIVLYIYISLTCIGFLQTQTGLFNIPMVATKHQAIIALALLTLSVDLWTFVDAEWPARCLNCEAPLNEWCCKTSWNGRCCEYPLDCDGCEIHPYANSQRSPFSKSIAENKTKTDKLIQITK